MLSPLWLKALMYLLMRTVSAYTGPDRLLGVFSTEAEAARARQIYLERILRHDPWGTQAYRVPSPSDVTVIADIKEIGLQGAPSRAFVVSEYAEGCGQITRTFLAICGTEADARGVVVAIESEEDSLPVWREIDAIEVGTLLSDTGGQSDG
jgi:hypothetical protein